MKMVEYVVDGNLKYEIYQNNVGGFELRWNEAYIYMDHDFEVVRQKMMDLINLNLLSAGEYL